jgi:hypothetical protein
VQQVLAVLQVPQVQQEPKAQQVLLAQQVILARRDQQDLLFLILLHLLLLMEMLGLTQQLVKLLFGMLMLMVDNGLK